MTPSGSQHGRDKLPFDFDENELSFEYMRSPGPGGQNVNKLSTACRLRIHLESSVSIPDAIKRRLTTQNPTRINSSGELVITANRYRTQAANRNDAVQRLVALLVEAAKKPKIRRPTKPTLASKHRRLDSKKRRSLTKQRRRDTDTDSHL